jgi:uncharacterized protein YyaL (SSP411 family)
VNRLASETSPYLRQHADNPVDWFPWSHEAFERAKELDKPVMLSVGYSACHWCHVMAHESFENDRTAAEINRRFVSVKVDREERPDVDSIYMEAVQALSGHGGWPMTVFLTPDGRPFYAGTYFPPRDTGGMPGFGRVLEAVDEAWRNRRDEVERQADALTDAVSRRARLPDDVVVPHFSQGSLRSRASTILDAAAKELSARFDELEGGFSPAPKFPHPTLVELCLQHHRLTEAERSLEMATVTLQAMQSGGIYDHLGGGFHRYSTDGRWTVPHFEKMLYDQAGLTRSYLHAWQVTSRMEFLEVVGQTIDYVLRDLALDQGGLCCAEDADSEGEEGRFYTWSPDEIAQVLGPDAGVVCEWYGVDERGNFEGRSILRRPLASGFLRPEEVERGRIRLFEARSKRVRPGRDDKVLTEWNAMFGSALAEAAGATGRDDWARAANRVAEFLMSELRRSDGRWLRSWKDAKAQHLAYAADYAWLVDFFTRMSELEGRAVWIDRAIDTAREMLRLFSDDERPLSTTGNDAEPLLLTPMEMSDGATPSATSVAARALMRLGALSGDRETSARGEALLATMLALGEGQPLAVASAVSASTLAEGGITEVVVGGDRRDLVGAALARYEPNMVLAWGEPTDSPLWEGRSQPVAYVCHLHECHAPSSDEADLADRLDAERDTERAGFSEALAR